VADQPSFTSDTPLARAPRRRRAACPPVAV